MRLVSFKQGRRASYGLLQNGRILDLPELETIMRTRLDKRKDMEVVIRADLRATVKHLQETTDVCHRLGVKTPNVSYQVSP